MTGKALVLKARDRELMSRLCMIGAAALMATAEYLNPPKKGRARGSANRNQRKG